MTDAWRHLRAAFVLFHLGAIFVAGMPSTDSALRRAAWEDPTVQAELSAWAARFGVEEKPFEDRLYTFAVGWSQARKRLEAPFARYLAVTATDQSWQMFVAPHLYPTRFEIAVKRGDADYRTVFRERSATETWNAALFGTERMRATIFRWGWGVYATPYHKGCAALARRLFDEDAEVVRVRCRFWKAKSPSPEEARDGGGAPGKYVYPWEVTR